MAYAQGIGKVILFGGVGSNDEHDLGDTWAYDAAANTWACLDPGRGGAPGGLSFAAMAHDPRAGRTILFGGMRAGCAFDETWAYQPDGNAWVRVDRRYGEPPGRTGHAMVYDENGTRVILFGGWNALSAINDIWAHKAAPAHVNAAVTGNPSVR